MTLAVYAIFKNEEQNVAQWLENVKQATAIYVLDTGSTDDTYALLLAAQKQYKNLYVEQKQYTEFAFDTARNDALAMVEEEWAMFLDADERLSDNWLSDVQSAIEKANADSLSVTLAFEYTTDEIAVSYPRLAIHKTRSYEWMYPAHEVLVPTTSNMDPSCDSTSVIVYHRPTDKERNYVDLLRKGVQDYPQHSRVHYYLGREYMYLQRYDDALAVLLRATELEQNDALRSEQYRHCGAVCEHMDRPDLALRYYTLATVSFPQAREAYAALAVLAFTSGLYYEAIGLCERMARIERPTNAPLILESRYYEGAFVPHMLAAAFNAIGDKTKAQHYIVDALAREPQNQTIIMDMLVINNIEIKRG